MDAKDATFTLIEKITGKPMEEWAQPIRIGGLSLLEIIWPLLQKTVSWGQINELPYPSAAEDAADEALLAAAMQGTPLSLDAASPQARRVIFERLVQLALALSAEDVAGISETAIIVPSDLCSSEHWRVALTWILFGMPLPWPPGAFDRHGPQLRGLAQTIQ